MPYYNTQKDTHTGSHDIFQRNFFWKPNKVKQIAMTINRITEPKMTEISISIYSAI